ncbi:hypothetical protein JCM15640A_22690 [Hoylesella timonensis 4401737 = DSM 22865 = JCM 15640]
MQIFYGGVIVMITNQLKKVKGATNAIRLGLRFVIETKEQRLFFIINPLL